MQLPYTIETIITMSEGVFLVNRDRQITFWNRSASSITGFDQQDTFGKSFSKYIKCHVDSLGEPISDAQCPLKKALNTGEAQQMVTIMKNKAGHLLPVNIHVMPYFNEAGFVAGAIESFTVIGPKQMPVKSKLLTLHPNPLDKSLRKVNISA